MKDQHYRSIDDLITEIAGLEIEELVDPNEEGPHLITVDELRAAGALDVPAAWRKSLGEERDLLFDMLADDSPDPTERGRVEVDTGDEASRTGSRAS